MRNFLTYVGVFAVSMAAQFFVFDSMRVSVWFNPLAYAAFIVLLPVNTRPLAMIACGAATGMLVDFFEGTAGMHTAALLFTAYARRWMMAATLGRDAVEETMGMPSAKLLGTKKFLRYAALVCIVHCLVCFSLEALTWRNYHLVLVRTAVSSVFTFAAVWAMSLLFSTKTRRRAI